MEEKERFFSTLVETTIACAEKEKKQEVEQKSNKQVQEMVLIGEAERSGIAGGQCKKQSAPAKPSAENGSIAVGEEKAAKIQRLRSGFRICKPQGTFRWPNSSCVSSQNNGSSNISSHKVVVQVEDLFTVPTPPSVSSSTATAPPRLPNYYPSHQHSGPVSPVKPVPERRAIKVSVSSVTNDSSRSTPANKTTTLINLNDDPFNNGERLCGAPSSRQTITSNAMMPNLFPSTDQLMKGELVKTDPGEHAVVADSIISKGIIGSSTTDPTSTSSSMPKQEGTWLALATPPAPEMKRITYI